MHLELNLFYTIYKITNVVNNKYYIGKHQTKNLDDDYMGSGKMLNQAITKYGIENFSKEILHVFDNDADMNAKEKELVTEEFCKRDDTYNLCNGGNGGFGYINRTMNGTQKKIHKAIEMWQHLYKTDPEWREWRRERMQEVFQNPERRAKMSRAMKAHYADKDGTFKGKTHTEETKQKIKQSSIGKHTGDKNSQYGTCWITNGSINLKIKIQDLILWHGKGFKKGRAITKSTHK